MTLIEPGGARTEFRYGSAQVATSIPEYDATPAFRKMHDPTNGLAPGDPVHMAARIVESVGKDPSRYGWSRAAGLGEDDIDLDAAGRPVASSSSPRMLPPVHEALAAASGDTGGVRVAGRPVPAVRPADDALGD